MATNLVADALQSLATYLLSGRDLTVWTIQAFALSSVLTSHPHATFHTTLPDCLVELHARKHVDGLRLYLRVMDQPAPGVPRSGRETILLTTMVTLEVTDLVLHNGSWMGHITTLFRQLQRQLGQMQVRLCDARRLERTP